MVRTVSDTRHFPTISVRFSYRKSPFPPMAEAVCLWPNDVDSTRISIMAEKLLDRRRRIIRVKHYSLRTDVRTTMIYMHVVQRGALGARSPLDGLNRSFFNAHAPARRFAVQPVCESSGEKRLFARGCRSNSISAHPGNFRRSATALIEFHPHTLAKSRFSPLDSHTGCTANRRAGA